MQSYWMKTLDNESTLELRDVARPEPGTRQLLVRLHAAGMNRGELLTGLSAAGKAVGMEGAGEVVKLGADISGFQPGDRVMGRCTAAFSEYVLMDLHEVMRMPAALSWEEAASVPLTFMVVYDMLVEQGRLVASEWLLVNGISSGVGVAALQTAKALGARVIGTSGSAEKLARLQPLGLDIGLCTRKADFFEAVMQATVNKGVNLVVNAVGGSVFAEGLRCLAFEGRHATVGYVDGELQAELDLETLHMKRLHLFGVSNKLRTREQRARSVAGFITDVLPALADGRIRPLVDKVFAFGELAAAKACMDANQHLGKIVLAMPGER
ncbi:zinc-binding dehydrogenase [Polaromonas eurypsychrophila]|uniref:Quinone oxidoreductase n=1 Tax=Polaromonas eurypsychrophila TaxID=1614635 RepID=A0A916SLK3_9BURK|nr:zinc-binding dehydrogenase [Polaromonas eurypsychrophila]GGB05346.1 quinone oxidoreductase [Polaromonas eurypsychrophila]